ncbi:synaptosomal-associated protein 47 [Discoglossus pictus]
MNKEVSVRTWLCSYFLTSERRWVPGKLSLTPTHLRFTAENTDGLLVSFHLSSITEIKKESSSFIFSSITVLEKDQAKHWFSSLQPNRNVVFTVLEHFWREQLLSPQGREATATKISKGKELFNIVSGSHKCLEETAKVLHHQGEQFGNIMRDLNKIDGDLATADRRVIDVRWQHEGSRFKHVECRHVDWGYSWFLDSIVRTGPSLEQSSEMVMQDQAVSESEAQELRKILLKLKGIALEAETELERQDEELDKITSSTDHTIMSIDKQNRRMRKLL